MREIPREYIDLSESPDNHMTTFLRARYSVAALLVATLLGFLFVLSSNADTASAEVNHGRLVPESPERDVPEVLDGIVYAHAQVGDRIFVGGDFQRVRLTNGNTINQAYIFAYNVNTGVLDQDFRPTIDAEVRALTTSNDGNSLYVGGRFTRWDNQFPLRIARLDSDGDLDTRFGARVSAQVLGIAEARGSLFLAGDFTDVSGLSVDGIAKVDSVTGAVDTRFHPDLGDPQNGTNLAREVVATANGSRVFVLHYARTVDRQSRAAVVSFDVSNNGAATLNGWRVPWEEQTDTVDCQRNLRAMAISPAGDFIVIGGQGADRPPNCDSVLRYPTSGNGTVNFQWSARMYSSVFSLAVSDVAVYAGGHFCAAPRNGAPAGGVTSTFAGAANQCEINDPNSPVNPSQIDPNGAVFRSQMAALNRNNGRALAWDPGSNNNVAVYDLTLTERGLLAGHDADRFNNIRVGRSGFFDLGGFTQPINPPAPPASAECSVRLDGQNRPVISLDDFPGPELSVRRNNVFLTTINGNSTTFTDTQASSGNNTYVIRYRQNGVVNVTCGSVNVPGGGGGGGGPVTTTCTTSLNGAGNPVVRWTAINGVSEYVVRDGGGWVGTVTNGTNFTDTNPADGRTTYTLRVRSGGVTSDIPCGTVTVDGGGGGNGGGALTCSVSLNNAGNPVIEWTQVGGVSEYQVRDNDGWVVTQTDDRYVDQSPAAGNRTYEIRYRVAGNTVDTRCGTVTVGGGGGNGGGAASCTASLNNAGEPVIEWTLVPGVAEYQVRDNDGWVATQSDDRYVDRDPTRGNRTYEIRYRQNGGNVDITCNPTLRVN